MDKNMDETGKYNRIKMFVLKVLAYFLPKPASAPEGTPVVTKKGIRKVMFMLVIAMILGALLVVFLDILKNTGFLGKIRNAPDAAERIDSSYSTLEILLFVLFFFIYILMPFLRYVRKWLIVTGTVYAFACGYILFFFGRIGTKADTAMLVIAVLLTIAFGVVPYLLFEYKNIRLSKNLSRITYISFVVMMFGSSVMRLFNQIPYLGVVNGTITDLSAFIWIRFLTGSIKIVIASLFIILAIDRTRDYINRGVSRKYEWLAAFTLFYTVTVIMLKIFELVAIFKVVFILATA